MHTNAHIFAGNLASARKPPFVVGFPLSPEGTVKEDERPYLEAKARRGDQDAFRRLYHQDPEQAEKKVLREHAITGCVYSAFGEQNHYDRWRALTELDQISDRLARGDLDAPRQLAAECVSTSYALWQTALIKLNSVNIERSDEDRRTYTCLLRTVSAAELMLLRAIKRLDDLDRRAPRSTGVPPVRSMTVPVITPDAEGFLEGEARRADVEDFQMLGQEPRKPYVGRGGSSPAISNNPTSPESNLSNLSDPSQESQEPPTPRRGTTHPDLHGTTQNPSDLVSRKSSSRQSVDVLQTEKVHETEGQTNLKEALLAYERWEEANPGWPSFAPMDPLFVPDPDIPAWSPEAGRPRQTGEYIMPYEERYELRKAEREARRRRILGQPGKSASLQAAEHEEAAA